jgi:hypothetical protein
MPKADQEHIPSTPAAYDFADISARMRPDAATATATDDAKLIRLCDRLVALEATRETVYATIDDDDEAARAIAPTEPEYEQARAALWTCGPATTDAGRRAVARAAIAAASKTSQGEIMLDTGDLSSCLAFSLCRSFGEVEA